MSEDPRVDAKKATKSKNIAKDPWPVRKCVPEDYTTPFTK